MILGVMLTIGGFNTQPRGGGCTSGIGADIGVVGFNTQPRGGGCFTIQKFTLL